jgi:protein-S-isoprenylcysteine O-methyltransferase Ste14
MPDAVLTASEPSKTIGPNSDAAMERYQRLRRAAVGLIFATLGLVMVFGRSVLPEYYHERLEMIGIMLIVVGIAGRLWSILYIGGRKSALVVETGPYSVTRNPLYLFSTVAAAGAGAQLGSVAATVGFAALCAVAFHFVILREEAFLRARLGAPYDAYRSRVPRFLPDFRLYREQAEVTFRPRVLASTLRDGLIFFLAMPLFETVERAQDAGVLPVLFHMW